MDLAVGVTDDQDRPLPVAGFIGTPEEIAELQAIVDSVRVERIVAAPSASPAP